MARVLRVDEELFMGFPNDTTTQFPELARTEGIFDRLRSRVTADPNAGDAAVIYVSANDTIEVRERSDSLGLPLTDEARRRTVELVGELSPDHKVSG